MRLAGLAATAESPKLSFHLLGDRFLYRVCNTYESLGDGGLTQTAAVPMAVYTPTCNNAIRLPREA